MEQNSGFKLYALISHYVILLLVLTIGGFLLGKYVIIQTDIAGGIIATIGGLSGIILLIKDLFKFGKKNGSQKV